VASEHDLRAQFPQAQGDALGDAGGVSVTASVRDENTHAFGT
jgi:hypothetical protein